MNFQLTDQQLSIQNITRQLAQTELLPTVLKDDEEGKFPEKAYAKMGQMGLIGLPFPKEYGGQGADYLSYVLAVEEISKVNSSVGIAYSVCTSLFSGGLINSASEELKKKYLPDVLSGKRWALSVLLSRKQVLTLLDVRQPLSGTAKLMC